MIGFFGFQAHMQSHDWVKSIQWEGNFVELWWINEKTVREYLQAIFQRMKMN